LSHKPEGWFDRLVREERRDFIADKMYGRDGAPLRFAAWAALFEDHEYKVVAQDRLAYAGEEIVVSTVWLGVDHSFGHAARPLIFETLVFGPEHFPLTDEMLRYATEDEARAGHADILARVRSLVDLAPEG
jgi:hypothetical protein